MYSVAEIVGSYRKGAAAEGSNGHGKDKSGEEVHDCVYGVVWGGLSDIGVDAPHEEAGNDR